MAKDKYTAGVTAASKGQWETAHTAFLEAYRIKQHFQIAINLGAVELKVGQYRGAAEHLSYYLREAQGVSDEERRKAETMLAEAQAKVGRLRISVSAAGAEVLVDGASVGKAPLADPVFVEPGARVVEARLDGVGAAKENTTVAVGGEVKVSLQLGKGAAGAGASGGAAGAGALGGAAGTGAASGAARTGGSGGATGAGEPSGVVPTRLRTGIIIGGSAGVGAMFIAGIAFTAVANGKASENREKAVQAAKMLGAGGCPLPPPTTGICADTAAAFKARANFSNAAVWSFIGAGALGAATVIYAFTTKGAPKAAVRAAPVVTANGGGFTVDGAW